MLAELRLSGLVELMRLNTNGRFFHFDLVERASRRCALIAFVALMAAATQASTVEHPGILHKDDNCSSCHPGKSKGMSVHSAMAISCTVCHLAQTQGDMTTLSLVMPKEQICFACHEKSAALQQHSRVEKGICVDCHDSHSSNRRMLLREQVGTRPRNSMMLPRTEK